MKIVIVDDCREDVFVIKKFLGGYEVKIFYNAESFINHMEQDDAHYDLYLLDIYIESSINGIELAKKLRDIDAEATICFISNSEDFYREAYDLYAVQYLIKPIQKAAIEKLLDKVEKALAWTKEQSLTFTWRKGTCSIPYGRILYISSMGNTLSIYCKDGTVQKCTGKLNELQLSLDHNIFCRCHQSFLVNMYHVDRLSGYELIAAGCRIPISRRYYADIKRRYREMLFEEVD